MVYGKSRISFESFYSCEFYFLPKLLSFCKKNKIVLQICGCSIEDQDDECSFYKLILPEMGWNFIPKTTTYSSYDIIDSSYLIISCGSTLGLEALARNKRVAFFTTRGCHINKQDYNFGWPENFKMTGPFWINFENEELFNSVINFVYFSYEKLWNETVEKYKAKLIESDPGNIKFTNLINLIMNER